MRSNELLNPEGLRIDGRRANELRRIECHLSVDSAADGSAIIEIGQTKVLALVYGPHDARGKGSHDGAVINATVKVAPYSTSDRKYRSKNDKRLLELTMFIKESFEQVIITTIYPRSQIDIFIQIVHNDGGVIHAALNAASLALVNAGIALKDYLTCCSAGYVEETPILDLSQLEESSANQVPKFTVAVMPRSGRVVMINLESRMPLDKFHLVRNLAISGARQIRSVLDEAVKSQIKSVLQVREEYSSNGAVTEVSR